MNRAENRSLLQTLSQSALAMAVCCAFAGNVMAQASDSDESEVGVVQRETEDFMSDSGRVGAVVGSIAAGAAFANPFAPLLGNVAGFFIGKSTDFSEREEALDRGRNAQRRSIVPAGAGEQQSLALSGSESDSDSDEADTDTDVDFAARPDPVLAGVSSPEPATAAASESPEQSSLADAADVLPVPYDTGVDRATRDNLRRLETRPALLEGSQCPGSDTLRYRKRVAVTNFALAARDDASLGDLGDVRGELPRALYQRLADTGRVVPLSATDKRVFPNSRQAPTRRRGDSRLTRVTKLTRAMDVQFVVSGVIRDMSIVDSGAWNTSVGSQLWRSVGGADLGRRLVLDLYVHDGLSGALVMEQRFETEGDWDFPLTERVGFGSRAFDQSDYGRKVNQLVDEMAREVTANVVCQPFMAEIQRVDDRRIRIASGAESGLRPGVELSLYRSERFLDQSDAAPELRSTGRSLVLQQVTPEYSSGTLPVEGQRINVQRGDMVVVW